MQERYFHEPYQFIPPYRGKWWCYAFAPLIRRRMRTKWLVPKWKFLHRERLQKSIQQKAGVLLVANHCRFADTPVLAMLSVEIQQYFYYLASYHLFRQNRLEGWLLNRVGALSILREGADREALRECARILSTAERPLVLYPEGTWFRQNDRLGPLQEGASLIVRQALKKADRPIVVHPVAIKYWYLEDPRTTLDERLGRLEKSLYWEPQSQLDWVPRIEKLGSGLLALKEIEYLGQPQTGTVPERLKNLIGALLDPLERQYVPKSRSGPLIERIRSVRQVLSKKLWAVPPTAPEAKQWKSELQRLLLSEMMASHSLDYLTESCSYERLAETVVRIEESITDLDIPVGNCGAVVEIGEAMSASEYLQASEGSRTTGDPLMRAVASNLQDQLTRLWQAGPPPEWNCPPPMTADLPKSNHLSSPVQETVSASE